MMSMCAKMGDGSSPSVPRISSGQRMTNIGKRVKIIRKRGTSDYGKFS